MVHTRTCIHTHKHTHTHTHTHTYIYFIFTYIAIYSTPNKSKITILNEDNISEDISFTSDEMLESLQLEDSTV